MPTPSSIAWRLSAVAALAATLPAQAVWFPNIDDPLAPYFALAQPGDVVQLADSHPPFTLTKGLTLVSPPNGCRIIDWSGFPSQWDSVVAVPAGQHASLQGVHFDRTCNVSGCGGGSVSVSGEVDFDGCRFTPEGDHCVTITSGNAAMVHCSLAPFPGESADAASLVIGAGATCSITDCEIAGFDATVTLAGTQVRSSAAVSVGGTLIASRCTLVGGAGTIFNTVEPPSPALLGAGGVAFVSDTTSIGGSGNSVLGNQPGAAAVLASGNVFTARTTLVPGTGTVAGPPSTGVTPQPQLVGLRRIGEVSLGSAFTARATMGTATGPLAMVAALERGLVAVSPFVEPVLLAPTQAVVLAFAAPVPGATVDEVVPVPNTVSLLGAAVWLQALQFDGAAIRASALAGGIVH